MNSTRRALDERPIRWNQRFGKKTDEDLDEFLDAFEVYAELCGWSEEAKTASLLSSLEGRARTIVRGCKGINYNELSVKLRSEWETPGRRIALRQILEGRLRKNQETAEQYLDEIQNMARRAYVEYPEKLLKEQVLRVFLAGQQKYIQDIMISTDFTSIEQALTTVIRIETAKAREPPPKRQNRYMQVHEGKPEQYEMRQTYHEREPVEEEYQEPELDMDWVNNVFALADSDSDGRYDSEEIHVLLRMASVPMDKSTAQGICFFCKRPGHRWTKCFRLRDILTRNGMKPPKEGGLFSPRKSNPPYPRRDNTEKEGKAPLNP